MTEKQLKELLGSLSLTEKAFQLTQAPAPYYMKDAQIAGTEVNTEISERELALMGSNLYVYGPKESRDIQKRWLSCFSLPLPRHSLINFLAASLLSASVMAYSPH